MVQFITPKEAERVKEYDFREPEGRKANAFWGDLAKGGADLLDSGIKAADTATKLTIDDVARNDVNTLRQENINEYKELTGNILAVTQKAPTSPTGAPGAPVANASVSDASALINAPAGSPGAPAAIPGPISSQIRYIDKMNEGQKQGHFDSERFYGEVQERTANLISRYPGYADYIQSKVTHYLGTDPANAQREHLQHTIAQLLGTSHTQTQQEKWNSEVMQHYAPAMGPEWTAIALSAGTDLNKQNALRVQATTQISKDYRIQKDTQALANSKAALEARNVEAQTVFTGHMDNQYGKFMNTAVMGVDGEHQYTMPDVHASIATQAQTGKVDLEKNQRQALAVGAAKTEFFRNFENEWIKPRFDKNEKGEYTNSFSTLIPNPADKEAIMKKYRTGFDAISEQLGAGLGHLATTQASMGTNITDNAVLQILKNEGNAAIAGVSKAFGTAANGIIGNADTQSGYKISSQLGRQVLEAYQAKTLNAGSANSNTLKDQFDRLKAVNNADHRFAGRDPTPKEMETMVTQLTNVIGMPDREVPLQIKMNVMDVLSHPQTVNFLNQVSKEQQFKAYSTLFSADVTNFIKDHQVTEMWTRYKDTAGQSFNMIFGTYANDIRNFIKQDYKGTFTWNEKTQQIDYANERGFGLAQDRNRNPMTSAVDKINQGLRTYGAILKAEGQPITTDNLEALGLNLQPVKDNVNLDRLLQTLRTIPVPGEQTGVVEAGRAAPMRIPGITPKKSSSPASPEDEKNVIGAPLSAKEVSIHWGRPLKIDGKEVTGGGDKLDVLNNVVKTPEGKYYYLHNGKYVPINL